MLTARTKQGVSVAIDDADLKQTYYCPICRQPLIQKRGASVSHHFAHHAARKLVDGTTYTLCTDQWSYDSSDWHNEWLLRFPVSMRERVMERGDEKHLADIATEHAVILFQHSPISEVEYRLRTDFFLSCGMKVNWVFDLSNAVSSGEIAPNDAQPNMYYWPHVRPPFHVLDYKERRVFVFFQLRQPQDAATIALEQVVSAYGGANVFYTDAGSSFTIPAFVARFTPATFSEPARSESAGSAPKAVQPVPDHNTAEKAARTADEAQKAATIQELWKSEYSSMIIRNVKTDRHLLIKGSEGKILRSDRRPDGPIIGKRTFWNDKKGRFDYTKFFVVDDADKPVWVLHKCFLLQDEPQKNASEAQTKAQHRAPNASEPPVSYASRPAEPTQKKDGAPANEPADAMELLRLFFAQDLPDMIGSPAGPATVERLLRDRGEAIVAIMDAAASVRSNLFRCPFTPKSFHFETHTSLAPIRDGVDTGILLISLPAISKGSEYQAEIDFTAKDGRITSAHIH